MLSGRPSKRAVVRVPGRTVPYVETRPQPQAFEWELLRAIYMGEAFPAAPSELFLLGLERLRDVNALAREQIAALRRASGNRTASAILDRVDDLMDQIVSMVDELAPLLRWFRTERIRIGPMPIAPLVEATDAVHRRLAEVIEIYLRSNGSAVDESGAKDQGLERGER